MTTDSVILILFILIVFVVLFGDALLSLFDGKPKYKRRDKTDHSAPPLPKIDRNRTAHPTYQPKRYPEQKRELHKPPAQEQLPTQSAKQELPERKTVHKPAPQIKPEKQNKTVDAAKKHDGVTQEFIKPIPKPKIVTEPPKPAIEVPKKEFPKREFPDFDNSRLLGMGLSQSDADEFVLELVEQIESHIPLIEAAIEKEAYDQVERLSHSLKGSATNLGTGGVADVLIDFNTYTKNGKDKEIILAHMENLKNYHTKLKSQFS